MTLYSEKVAILAELHNAKARLAEAALEIERLRAALTLLTDGWKYSADVCAIARDALHGPPGPVLVTSIPSG